jgi:hypothetical protein
VFPTTSEQYDNGINNIVPTLISMNAEVQQALLLTCHCELAGQLLYQKGVNQRETAVF